MEEPKQRAEKFYLDKPRLLLGTTLSPSVYIVDQIGEQAKAKG